MAVQRHAGLVVWLQSPYHVPCLCVRRTESERSLNIDCEVAWLRAVRQNYAHWSRLQENDSGRGAGRAPLRLGRPATSMDVRMQGGGAYVLYSYRSMVMSIAYRLLAEGLGQAVGQSGPQTQVRRCTTAALKSLYGTECLEVKATELLPDLRGC